MSILRVTDIRSNGSTFNDVVTHSNSGGTENGRHCRAFVNFNGQGAVAIRAQFNVSSITDNGVGDFTMNFANAMVDANYSAQQSTGDETANGRFAFGPMSTPTTTTYKILTTAFNGISNDFSFVSVAIFR